jgi:hypothetical protein
MNVFNQSVVDRKRWIGRAARLVYVSLLLSVAVRLGACAGPYVAPPPPPYGGAAYVAPASVSVEIGDRPYYTRGPGYYAGPAYYVWRPGHWSRRNGVRVWVHGHYVLRG